MTAVDQARPFLPSRGELTTTIAFIPRRSHETWTLCYIQLSNYNLVCNKLMPFAYINARVDLHTLNMHDVKIFDQKFISSHCFHRPHSHH